MRFALSTNWCNRRMESGEEIADKAEELGFDGLELGFHTTDFQVAGFRSRLDRMPVGSVHAFCPVPLSAPQGYPELYQLASFDEEARKMARLMIRRNVAFAADIGATALVLHAGRVPCDSWFRFRRIARRGKGGRRMIGVLLRELELLTPDLERFGVRLGLENLPYLAGFPDLSEVGSVTGEWVRPWLDTGHWYAVRSQEAEGGEVRWESPSEDYAPLGFHLNDSNGGDDHLAPGDGRIDFSAFLPMMESAAHLVLEPNPSVTDEQLRAALGRLRDCGRVRWGNDGSGTVST